MLHTPATHPWLVALEQSGLGATMRQSLMVYPLVEILHILGFALLVGAIVAFDLRVLGLGRGVPMDAVGRVTLPVAIGGFFLAAPMGFLLFTTEATHIAVNPAFQVKLACILFGLGNALLFRIGPWRRMADWGAPGHRAPASARLGALLSLAAWLGAIGGGRLIAYL